jgi:hypothetical protein
MFISLVPNTFVHPCIMPSRSSFPIYNHARLRQVAAERCSNRDEPCVCIGLTTWSCHVVCPDVTNGRINAKRVAGNAKQTQGRAVHDRYMNVRFVPIEDF